MIRLLRVVFLCALVSCLALPALAQPKGAPPPDAEGWIPLFDGQSLAGWQLRDKNGPNGWSAKDGVLSNTAPSTDLVTEMTFTDHELHVEFRLPRGGNSGVYLQGRYEVQVADSAGKPTSKYMCGAIYDKIAPSKNAAKPAGQWQTLDIKFIAPRADRQGNVVQKARITVTLNGVTVIDNAEIDGVTGGALDNNEGKPGPLMLQGNHTSVDYRNIKYRPLRVGWPDDKLFTPLFDGKTLTGWSVRGPAHGGKGRWEVRDGAIVGTQDPPGIGGVLMTEKKFGDFEIRCEINPDWGIDSGLFLRTTDQGACYQCTVDYRPGGQVGTLYGERSGGWLQQNPLWEKFYWPGRWNELRCVVRGQPPHIQIWLNGNLTVDFWDTKERLPAEGYIGLQVHRGHDWQGRLTRFRNIRILPLGK